MVKIEIDNQVIEARDGAMVIEAADEAGIYIPRFCYHKKLSVAANCRMCLVSVEKARKPLPACATPVTDGMKISTKSSNAISAQKGVMEFLLINHPLDCPICDQGGECELQDIAMGYGNDVSRYCERKRVVPDKNIGPLIATEMTRCIHCTRCVRFGEEIAGIKELGATGRGEHMQIGTYIEHAVESEMSGNVIDLCPVGALTSKPFRFRARSWEMQQRDSIASHDCIGSNVHVHLRRSDLMRVVPRENESINETWISDRDRFSYEGHNAGDRATQPMIKSKGSWKSVDWETALETTFKGLNKALNESTEKVGFLASPNATCEELYLLQKLARSQGVNNIDHRLRQQDFTTQNQHATFRSLGQSIADLESVNAALFIGSNVRKDQPIAGHRIRKAALNGAAISFINTRANEFRFPVTANIASTPDGMLNELAGVLASITASDKNIKIANSVKALLSNARVTDHHKAIAQSLLQANESTVILGPQALHQYNASQIEALASSISQATGSKLGYLTEGANASGASIVGVLPHRAPGGASGESVGLNASQMFEQGMNAYLLMGIEPEFDVANPRQTVQALQNAEFVVVMTNYVTDTMKGYADVILPMAATTETAGTFVNVAGQWQQFNGCVPARGEARPAWKILRVLGNLLNAEGFDYVSVEDIYNEFSVYAEKTSLQNNEVSLDSFVSGKSYDFVMVGGTGIYRSDAVVRRAPALQATSDAQLDQTIAMSAATAAKAGLAEGNYVKVTQGDAHAIGILRIDNALAEGCVSIAGGTTLSATLAAAGKIDSIEKTIVSENNEQDAVRASHA